jgi:hypothetical protein
MAENYVSVGGRGTSRRIVKKEEDNWTGSAFKDLQEKRKEESKNTYISVGRGTSKIKFGDMNTSSQRPSGKGMWVSSGRGTGKRLLK